MEGKCFRVPQLRLRHLSYTLTSPPFPSWRHCTVRMRILACPLVQAPFGVSVPILGVGEVDVGWGYKGARKNQNQNKTKNQVPPFTHAFVTYQHIKIHASLVIYLKAPTPPAHRLPSSQSLVTMKISSLSLGAGKTSPDPGLFYPWTDSSGFFTVPLKSRYWQGSWPQGWESIVVFTGMKRMLASEKVVLGPSLRDPKGH